MYLFGIFFHFFFFFRFQLATCQNFISDRQYSAAVVASGSDGCGQKSVERPATRKTAADLNLQSLVSRIEIKNK